MNNQLKAQLEFQIKANQSEIKLKRKPLLNERIQRFNLTLEENCELGEAYGIEVTMIKLLEEKVKSLKAKLKGIHPIQDSEVYDERAALDATIDIAVINNGSIICNGHHTIFDREYENVSNNNLTKFTRYPLEAQETIDFHTKNGKEHLEIDEVIYENEQWYSVKDLGNFGKILKPKNYESVELNIEL
jgi:hypothetical protein